ncbi:ring-1,2-phenylacetyl-CoA epoxidase subunit PaaC [Chishuiella changwenlii]|jgi:ring-1,2-phenylacetyl-CoA epoxidase subunit PaaC|uniref:Phenylacetic acid degradation protein n=1 Tax=Chishuiella changwenlii TaxID=1434701 RepID=A0A1M7CEL1_9FLAO|nr:1,2-phenylacetyl-CoA epoxidase subunit PaaC [Chishuiella changwenlii]GGF06289.1 phenylacetic acid degradation protein [Chishuiella changwenlii]SHL65695.1 ring-1,2-phenylacetyl-CoA epoxidase subunit PaaC [Chishuiella changwenlii]
MTSTVYQNNQNYIDFILHLADTNLILAQRLCEWCGHGPILEQDIAISNIALDLLGQTSNYYNYAAELIGNGATEDTLAMLRNEREYKNLLLTELPNGHFGDTIVRQFFYDSFHYFLLEQFLKVKDLKLQSIVEKSLKEVKYHTKWSSEWMIRLGDGTQESHDKIQEALNNVLPYVGEMFIAAPYQKALIEEGLIPDPINFKAAWLAKVNDILEEATLTADIENTYPQKGGKVGVHTEHLGFILTDLQYMQRTYPNLQW